MQILGMGNYNMGPIYINYLGTNSLKRYFIDFSIGVNIYVTFCVNLSSF